MLLYNLCGTFHLVKTYVPNRFYDKHKDKTYCWIILKNTIVNTGSFIIYIRFFFVIYPFSKSDYSLLSFLLRFPPRANAEATSETKCNTKYTTGLNIRVIINNITAWTKRSEKRTIDSNECWLLNGSAPWFVLMSETGPIVDVISTRLAAVSRCGTAQEHVCDISGRWGSLSVIRPSYIHPRIEQRASTRPVPTAAAAATLQGVPVHWKPHLQPQRPLHQHQLHQEPQVHRERTCRQRLPREPVHFRGNPSGPAEADQEGLHGRPRRREPQEAVFPASAGARSGEDPRAPPFVFRLSVAEPRTIAEHPRRKRAG